VRKGEAEKRAAAEGDGEKERGANGRPAGYERSETCKTMIVVARGGN